jgi:hypothetical protein
VFYRLLEIDGRPLPSEARIDGRPYQIYEGGLLLEPPAHDAEEGSPPEGHAILTLFGPRDTGDPVDGFLASASESYRWTAEGELDVSRSWAAAPTRFLGRVQGEQLQLRVAGASRLLSEAMELGFVAAPGLPIPPSWENALYFGPPHLHAPRELTSEEQRLVDEFVQQEDAKTRARAAERLARAWVAPI